MKAEGGGLPREVEDRARWPRQLASRLSLGEVGPAGAIVLVRHSIREAISGPSLSAATSAQLTEEGRDLCRVFGDVLPAGVDYRLFSSPVDRCAETASLVAESLRSRGLSAGLHGARSYLAGDFIVDPQPVVATFARVGSRGFMKAWHGGELPPEAIHPPAQAARELLAALLSERRSGAPGAVDLHVGHDLTVATVLGLVARTDSSRFQWPGYLDGVLIGEVSEGVSIWYRGEERAFTE